MWDGKDGEIYHKTIFLHDICHFFIKGQCQNANIKEKESLSSVLFIYSRRTVSVKPAFLLIFVKNYTISLC